MHTIHISMGPFHHRNGPRNSEMTLNKAACTTSCYIRKIICHLQSRFKVHNKTHLFLERCDVVEVDVGVTQGVDKVARLWEGGGEGESSNVDKE